MLKFFTCAFMAFAIFTTLILVEVGFEQTHGFAFKIIVGFSFLINAMLSFSLGESVNKVK